VKPWAGWLSYELEATGFVVDAACNPVSTCTNVYPPGSPAVGFLREAMLSGETSKRFHAIGPGLDVEADAGRFGPIGAALFLGGGAYAVLGGRTLSFGASESFNDSIGMDTATASFEVEVDPWVYRAHVGIRFQWLGRQN
jgi:hypothetical protein